MKLRIALAALLLVSSIGACSFFLGARAAVPVQVAQAQARAIVPAILASGTLVYDAQVTLVSEVLARVDEVRVREGDVVKKGEVLLRLDAEASRAEVEQARASRDQARIHIERQRINRDAAAAKLARYRDLLAQGLVEATKYDELVTLQQLAEVDLRNGRAAMEQAAAQLEQAQQRLAKTVIRAPIDGRVIQVSIKAGETAVPSAMSIAGGSLMIIADTRRLFAEVNIDEADISRVAVGQRAVVVTAAYPDRRIPGRVEQVAVSPRQNNGMGRSFPVRVRLDDADAASFRPGIGSRAEIATRSDAHERPAVPLQAVLHDEDQPDSGRGATRSAPSVFVLADGKVVRRRVVTGTSDDSHVEIRQGLQAGERVVVGPARTLRSLREGDAVESAPAASDAVGKAAP